MATRMSGPPGLRERTVTERHLAVRFD
jgi:hypothetical protein